MAKRRNANKISLNDAKTEDLVFKSKHKPCDKGTKLKLCRKYFTGKIMRCI